jgi:type II secretory pathway component PulF
LQIVMSTASLNNAKAAFGTPAANSPAPLAEPRAVSSFSARKVSRRDVANMTSQLAIMTKSGVDIASALAALARQSQHARLKNVLLEIHNQVMDGRPFSAALAGFSKIFGDTYVASVAAGEASGRMAEVLANLAQMQRRELKLRSTIRTLMAYPVMLSAVSGGVLMGLVLFVLPQFAAIFDRYEMPLPALTRFLLAIAGEVRTRFWLWLPLLASPVIALVLMRFSETGRKLRDRLLLRTLVIREVTRLLVMGRLCRLLGMMLQSGVTLVDSLTVLEPAMTVGMGVVVGVVVLAVMLPMFDLTTFAQKGTR